MIVNILFEMLKERCGFEEKRVKNISLIMIFIIVVAPLSFQTCHAVVLESEASLAISVAEDSLELAYLAVLEAEKAGGRMPVLVSELNGVLEFYSDAKNAFQTGDFEEAISVSREVVDLSRTIIDSAHSEILVAEREKTESLKNQLLISGLAASIIIILGYSGWMFFKSYYYRRMMLLKPEVYKYES